MTGHIVPTRTYVTIFSVLLLLTLATVLVASIDLGRFNAAAALGIATAKAPLVAAYFMHARSSTALAHLALAGGVYWLLILLGLTASDYLTRA